MNLSELLKKYKAALPATTPALSAPAAPASTPKLSERLGITTVAIDPKLVLHDPEGRSKFGRNAVQPSDELLRINALPRRERPVDNDFASYVAKWNGLLRNGIPGGEACRSNCVEKYGFCINSLNELQAWGLEEYSTEGGLIAKMAVGSGKTGLDVLLPMARPNTKVVVLLLKPVLRDQFLSVDFPQWAEHFKVPNLDSRYSAVDNLGRPKLFIYSYTDLSLPKNTALLKELNPDLVIADECQNLANDTASRTKRFVRFFFQRNEDGKPCDYAAGSGSLWTKSIMQGYHHYGMALREHSPLPVDPSTAKRWAKAVDPTPVDHRPTPIGSLRVFCRPGEDAATGLGRRVLETRGVVSSESSSVDVPLYLKARVAPPIPAELAVVIDQTRATGIRPDGEEPKTAFDKPKWLRQMACGFYYHYRFPRGEDEELINKWFARRSDWHKEIRLALEASPEYMDSPRLLENAAARYYRGYSGGKLPVWPALNYKPWLEIKDKVQPVEAHKWLNDYLLNDAAAWANERKVAGEGGVIWCEFSVIGLKLAQKLGVTYYNGGEENAVSLRTERGDKVIVCSIKGHGTGSNLQKFTRHLVMSNPADAGTWEQLLGRPHRYRQTKPVTFEVYRHTPELRSALDKAIERAEWLERFDHSPQKLMFAERDW